MPCGPGQNLETYYNSDINCQLLNLFNSNIDLINSSTVLYIYYTVNKLKVIVCMKVIKVIKSYCMYECYKSY